jgi:hypothetical protein
MTEQLEAQLRAELRRHAATVPPHAAARLHTIDYHPRAPLSRMALALGGGIGVAASAAVALSVIGLGAGTQRAFAGWSPVPTTPAGGQIAGAEAACKADMATPLERQQARTQATEPGSNSARELPPVAEGGEWQTMLADTRGPYTILLLANSDGNAQCLTGPGLSRPGVGVGEGANSGTQGTVPAGQIREGLSGFQRAADEQPYMSTSGRVGAGVSAVTVVLGDGTHVVASVANGWFLAWWPGTEVAVAAEVQTSSGTSTQQLHEHPLSKGQ